MAKGGMAEVVSKPSKLDKISIYRMFYKVGILAIESNSNRLSDLSNFQRVSKSISIKIGLVRGK